MIAFPDTASIRLHQRDGGWIVSIAPPGADRDPVAIATRRGLSAVLTHGTGMSWPDTRGEAMASAVLSQPRGSVILTFKTLADAMACQKRLKGGAR